jgi:hypothetical protein
VALVAEPLVVGLLLEEVLEERTQSGDLLVRDRLADDQIAIALEVADLIFGQHRAGQSRHRPCATTA